MPSHVPLPMHPADTTVANLLLQRALGRSAVESFGLSHQTPFLEFRDDEPADHMLSIDTDMTSNVSFDESLSLTADERRLLIFNRVNLRSVTRVACDDDGNLFLDFDNGVQLRFAGTSAEGYEPWQLGNGMPLHEPGGYLLIAQSGGGYAIWDGPAAPLIPGQDT
ncbi:hypothetical protein KB206_00345 [Microvirga sp. STS02]|uniref:DUF6188 family protein n=1 Tax=Hymenobacter negativus TaxID=2795026 RepID=UPI0018DD0D27|nr:MULTISPECIES: DUF6188 family protein [Bacteria]MBH8567314.1 hypothetical protein [Hymenobacter negativus]MBR7207046.1 hypothetical protein [Microvirga sp. STS02]